MNNEQLSEYESKMWSVVYELRMLAAVGLPELRWVACQQQDGVWMGVSAVFGNENVVNVFYTFGELDAIDTEDLAIETFIRIFGYKPKSIEDLQRRHAYWAERTFEAIEDLEPLLDKIKDLTTKCGLAKLELEQKKDVQTRRWKSSPQQRHGRDG